MSVIKDYGKIKELYKLHGVLDNFDDDNENKNIIQDLPSFEEETQKEDKNK